MKFVQPIRSKEKIEQMKEELRKNGTRDELLFTFGINVGFRISDILKLKVKDVLSYDRTVKSHIEIKEEKTKKHKRCKINSVLADELYRYTKNMDLEDYIFKSRNGKNRPITRVRAYSIINNAAKNIGLGEGIGIGTHTLRKTFAYWLYQQNHDIALLQKLLNHSSPSITLRYIGINQDILDNALDNFSL